MSSLVDMPALEAELMAIFTKQHQRTDVTFYYIRFSGPDGRRRVQKAGTTLKQARKVLRQRLGEVASGTYVDPRQARKSVGPRFNEFADRFLKEYAGRCRSDHYIGIVKRLKAHFGERLLRDIGRADLDRYAALRKLSPLKNAAEGKKPRLISDSTIRKELIALGTIFKMAVRWGVLSANPAVDMRKPSEPLHKVRYLSRDEWGRLDAIAPSWLKPMLRMAVATGMRLKEVAGLTWGNVDWQAELIHVAEDFKSGTRAIPLNATARAVLEGQVRRVGSPIVFLDATGEPRTSKDARMRISRATIAAMRSAKIPDASFHTLRHTAGSWMAAAGVGLLEIQKYLGHSTPTMTTRYAHLQPEHLRGGGRALDAALTQAANQTATRSGMLS